MNIPAPAVFIVWLFCLDLGVHEAAAVEATPAVAVDLQLLTGGGISGLVVDHNAHGLVIVRQRVPYVFAWNELDARSAYVARRDLLAVHPGGAKHVAAEDHFQLGLYMLTRDRRDLAATEFAAVRKLSGDYARRIAEAFARFRAGEESRSVEDRVFSEEPSAAPSSIEASPLADLVNDALPPGIHDGEVVQTPVEVREKTLTIYKSFGETVQRAMGKEVVLIETDHFLIWTDCLKGDRDRLARLCERMYAALCGQFNISAAQPIFLAKCPVFCWSSKGRFRKFARLFDGFDGKDAVGYTRSIERKGHVHMVLVRQGRSSLDEDRFACTLVHEGTHAFLHRLHTTRLIPHWVNEGYAELTTQRVLGDRCPASENAALLARQYARYGWPIGEFLRNMGPIDVHQYPLAHGVVAYLESLGKDRLASLILDLKDGKTLSEALAARFDGMTFDQLEERWLCAWRTGDGTTPAPGEAALQSEGS